jgi:hypothetical protein
LPRFKILALYKPSKQNWSEAQNPVLIVIAKTTMAFIVQAHQREAVTNHIETGTLTFDDVWTLCRHSQTPRYKIRMMVATTIPIMMAAASCAGW